ncbi:MAG: hypothetical protein AAFO69_13515 [Bacteroidota bacterium]
MTKVHINIVVDSLTICGTNKEKLFYKALFKKGKSSVAPVFFITREAGAAQMGEEKQVVGTRHQAFAEAMSCKEALYFCAFVFRLSIEPTYYNESIIPEIFSMTLLSI